jgi:hypothetical protein
MFEGMFPTIGDPGQGDLANALAKMFGGQNVQAPPVGGMPGDSFGAALGGSAGDAMGMGGPAPTPTVQPPAAPALPLGSGDGGIAPAANVAPATAQANNPMARLAAGLKGIAPVAPPQAQKVSSPNAPQLAKIDGGLAALLALASGRKV